MQKRINITEDGRLIRYNFEDSPQNYWCSRTEHSFYKQYMVLIDKGIPADEIDLLLEKYYEKNLEEESHEYND